MFQMSTDESLEFAQALVGYIIGYKRQPKTRPDWTNGNLNALRSFAELRFPGQIKSYIANKHSLDGNRTEGEYLSFDYGAYKRSEGFVIFAESEFDNSTDENLQGDFEKLLYVRSLCKVMMCWVSNAQEAIRTADMLSNYAKHVCNEFVPDEVYVLYFANWISDREEAAFVWQAPSGISNDSDNFTFRPLQI